jgi:mRNA interferase RelE/StbE
MRYSIRFTPHAQRDFTALDRTVQQRLRRHIDRLGENPFPPGARKLNAEEAYYRIREGDYRVIYLAAAQQLAVIVVKIGHRKEIYR